METPRFTVINEAFTCVVCGCPVQPLAGSCRNHCPQCLCSVHVDRFPGDRAADCGGIMRPVSIELTSRKGWIVRHRCEVCGTQTVNKLALEDPFQPDDMELVMRLIEVGQYKM
ncbi:MAG: RNHCP domain-containing protein [Firmicutes bacterium]|nr:RNHCP domain-containing protein [Bacillota bacterium]